MHRYHCTVTPSDTMVVYETQDGKPTQDVMAFVMENADGEKISVCLKIEDVMNLRNQLTQMIGDK